MNLRCLATVAAVELYLCCRVCILEQHASRVISRSHRCVHFMSLHGPLCGMVGRDAGLSRGLRSHPVGCRQEESVAKVVDDTVARFGTLNTFVRAASVHPHFQAHRISSMQPEHSSIVISECVVQPAGVVCCITARSENRGLLGFGAWPGPAGFSPCRACARMQVNNAGICFHNHVQDLFETSMEDFDKTQAVNFRGVFLGLKHASRCASICLHSGGGAKRGLPIARQLGCPRHTATVCPVGRTFSPNAMILASRAITR